MTDPFVFDLAKLLADRLTEPAADADDFVRLASVGEPVRRAVALLNAVPADVASSLATYENALTAFRGPVPSTLENDATAVAAELDAYRGAEDPDGDAALALILELDAIVATTVAAERTGRLPHGTVDAMATRLEQTLAGISHRAPHLAQLAENRWLAVGDDPDLVGAYGWLDVLAEAAPSRVRIDAIVKDSAAREQRVDEALKLLARPRPVERLSTSLTVMPPYITAQLVHHARFATAEASVPDQKVLVENEDLSVFIEENRTGTQLVVAFAPPLWLDDVRASLDGVALEREAGGPREFRFALPERGGQLRFDLQIGEEVVSHQLELRRPA